MKEIVKLQEPHSCPVRGNNYISLIDKKWYFVTDERRLYAVRYCPYCGEKLEDEQ